MSRLPHPRLARTWKVASSDPAAAGKLAGELGLHPVAAALLSGRGYADPVAARTWLEASLRDVSDPFRLPGMSQAVERLGQAIRNGERITIFGDYDVDGLTSTALLTRVLARLGVVASPVLPLRMEEGYGLSLEALDRCLESTRPDLIVTVDCGTGSVAAVNKARDAGVDVIVTDHHQPGPDVASAVAVVNPRLGSDASQHVLAGVGVAFKLAHALYKQGIAEGTIPRAVADSLKEELDLVAIGTVADIVPLTGENRILVQAGLKRLQTTSRPGLLALKEAAGIRGEVGTYEVGYLIGPRLNASGRLGNALASLEILLTDDPNRASHLAAGLDAENRERQGIERKLAESIMCRRDVDFDPARDLCVIEAGEGWHSGVIGIVASRLVARYHRPAVVVSFDEDGRGRGSGRSIAGFDLASALQTCSRHLVKCGGHAMAAGLEITRDNFHAFSASFEAWVREELAGRDLHPTQRIDVEARAADCTLALLDDLDRLRPFGPDFPAPVFGLNHVEVFGAPREVGQGHLKFQIRQDGAVLDVIGFGFADRGLPEGRFDIAGTLQRDTYGRVAKPQLNLMDVRAPAGD
ncbi:MAG TPA: single-stranded-DNA-specific exonuclease RecJ [Kiritimatiellia bacterium]|nr:single-stranded-DNA-specific exonuclease RecJ [Kiritimatiellia bacterium]